MAFLMVINVVPDAAVESVLHHSSQSQGSKRFRAVNESEDHAARLFNRATAITRGEAPTWTLAACMATAVNNRSAKTDALQRRIVFITRNFVAGICPVCGHVEAISRQQVGYQPTRAIGNVECPLANCQHNYT